MSKVHYVENKGVLCGAKKWKARADYWGAVNCRKCAQHGPYQRAIDAWSAAGSVAPKPDLNSPAHDPVETPLHYRWHPSGVECIDIAAAFDYSLGNVIKYVWRCDYKGKPVEDLKKAATYLQRAIEERE